VFLPTAPELGRADLGDLGGDVGPLGQLADAVVAADEFNFLAHRSFPSAAARRGHRLAA